MEDRNQRPTISRRQLIAGAAATAGVAAAVGGVYGLTELVKSSDKAESEPHVRSIYVTEPVPADDPDSSLWREASPQRVTLQGQNVIVPLKTESVLDEVAVRSLHDGETIAFLLEWQDSDKDEHTIKSDQFRDGCGVMLGAFPAPAALWTMGMPDSPVTILHWKADWQLDIDAGFQDLEVAFPNVSSDFYPPLVGVVSPKIPDDYPEEVRNRLPGWSVGNPISQPTKTSPVEKLRAIGPGTLEHLATQNATGRGTWNDGKWKAVIAKPMDSVDEEETSIVAGQSYSVAFTVWSGADTDRGSRKSLTNLGQLDVEAAT